MGTLLRIALRNILRHKRRTITSAITIAVGIWFFIFMDSVWAGIDRGSIDNIINLTASAVKVQTLAYEQQKESWPLDYGVGDIGKLRAHLAADPRVTGFAPRTRFIGRLSNYAETVPVIGTVIDPAADTTVFTLTKFIEGRCLSDTGAREIILGKKLAADLGVDTGGTITLYALTRYESHNADEFKVVGLLNTTDPALNGNSIFIPFSAADDLLDLDGLVTEVNIGMSRRVNLKDMTADAREVQLKIKTEFPHLAPATFMDIAGGFLEIGKSKRAFGAVFLLILLLIAAVGIFNTVLMSVYERIREVGVLRALGLKPSQISLMFAMESFFTGLAGSLLGLALGAATDWVLVVYGYPLDKLLGDTKMSGFPYWGTVYGEWNVGTMALLFVFGLVMATVAGIIPARKAGRMEVTQALRFN